MFKKLKKKFVKKVTDIEIKLLKQNRPSYMAEIDGEKLTDYMEESMYKYLTWKDLYHLYRYDKCIEKAGKHYSKISLMNLQEVWSNTPEDIGLNDEEETRK